MIPDACRGDFVDRGPACSVPLTLLGGYRWPGARQIDVETMAKIYWAEIAEPPANRGTSLNQRQTLKNVRDQLADEPLGLETRG